ncbi:MAG: Asd/ArgC dimerization domain-containing protein [Candidatus Aminicenantia bacterium]
MTIKKEINLAIVGTLSLRGKELQHTLDKIKFPIKKIKFLDPNVKEEYTHLTEFRGEAQIIQSIKKEHLYNMDLVFFTADYQTSINYCSLAKECKFRAIDLCEVFNSWEDIPLVVSGVNDNILKKEDYLIANPHPLSVILSTFLHFINQKFSLAKALAIAVQPASEYETQGIDELMNQSIGFLNLTKIPKSIFKEQIAFNLISQVGQLEEDGFTDSEKRINQEIRRILFLKDLPLSLCLIQAPVFHTYSIMVFVELNSNPQLSDLEDTLKKSSLFKTTPPKASPPSPITTAGKDEIYIGQIKKDQAIVDGFWFWLVADNLTRGSVLNAIEVAKKILSLDSLPV